MLIGRIEMFKVIVIIIVVMVLFFVGFIGCIGMMLSVGNESIVLVVSELVLFYVMELLIVELEVFDVEVVFFVFVGESLFVEMIIFDVIDV